MSDAKTITASRRETSLVLGLLGLILLLNLVTAVAYPHVWTDEVMYTDPASNLVLGRGFTSTAWYAQVGDRFFASNTPLHPVVLSGWIRMFGFTPLAVRSINFVWFTLGTIFLWRFCLRIRWLENLWLKLLFFGFLACDVSFSFSYRSGRPDMIGYAIVALGLLATTIPARALRYACLLALGFLLPLAGLQLLLYLLVLTVLGFLFRGFRAGMNDVLAGCGAALGLVGLYLLYQQHGVWSDFLATVSRHTVGSTAQDYRKGGAFGLAELFVRDRSAPFLILLAIMAAIRARKVDDRTSLHIILFGLSAALFIPLTLNTLGVFPIYYGWMSALPLSLALFQGLTVAIARPLWFKSSALVLITAAMFIGLPLHLLIITLRPEQSYAVTDQFVAEHLTASDEAYTDFSAFYPASRTARKIYQMHYLNVIRDDERAAITALVIDPNNFPKTSSLIPGNWRPVAEFISKPMPNYLPDFIAHLLESQMKGSIAIPYHLVIYRKQPTEPSSTEKL